MSIKQQGGVFGRNPTFNDVTIEGELTFDGDVDINSDLKIDGDLEVTDQAGIGVAPGTDRLHVGNGTFRVSGNSIETIISYSSYGIFGTATNHDLQVRTNNVETGRFKPGIGLAFPSGYGIDFSATAGTGTSELFDDYEEGVWDCVIKDAYTGNVGSTHTGNYTKIGKVVVITVVCSNITTVGLTAGNDIYFTGLPFSPAAVSSGSVSANDVVFTGYLSAQNAGAPYFRLSETASGATKGNVLVSQITSGSSDVWVQLTYEV